MCALAGVSLRAWWVSRATPPGETEFLPGVSAFCPWPSPDGTMVAYVRVGWAGMGEGRSNLETDVFVTDARGKLLDREPVAPGEFLRGWTPDGMVFSSRDGKTAHHPPASRESTTRVLLGPDGRWFHDGRGWSVPSPDGKRVASLTQGTKLLRVTDPHGSLTEIGEVFDCPVLDWEWMGSTWSPWSPDGSSVAFVSSQNDIVLASPDGRVRKTVTRPTRPAALPTVSPDGRHVAFVTYDPTPLRGRPDLEFYGGAVVWVAPNRAGGKAVAVTKSRPETCFHLRWLGDSALVFDRLKPTPYDSPRIFKVEIDPDVLGEE